MSSRSDKDRRRTRPRSEESVIAAADAEARMEALQRRAARVGKYLYNIAAFAPIAGFQLMNRGQDLAPKLPFILGLVYLVVGVMLAWDLRRRLERPRSRVYPLLAVGTALALAMTVTHYVTAPEPDASRWLTWGVFGWAILIGMPWFGVVGLLNAYRRAGLIDGASPRHPGR